MLARESHSHLDLIRPGKLNAFTVRMASELTDAFVSASADDAVVAVVVTGAGRAFCAGRDLGGTGNRFGLDEDVRPTMADLNDRFDDCAIVEGVRDAGGRVALAIFDCKKPAIATINYPAIGADATLTLAMMLALRRRTHD